jgi:hypothetical protein
MSGLYSPLFGTGAIFLIKDFLTLFGNAKWISGKKGCTSRQERYARQGSYGNSPDMGLHGQQPLEGSHHVSLFYPPTQIIHHALHLAPADVESDLY